MKIVGEIYGQVLPAQYLWSELDRSSNLPTAVVPGGVTDNFCNSYADMAG
jgi:hypothetical protein